MCDTMKGGTVGEYEDIMTQIPIPHSNACINTDTWQLLLSFTGFHTCIEHFMRLLYNLRNLLTIYVVMI